MIQRLAAQPLQLGYSRQCLGSLRLVALMIFVSGSALAQQQPANQLRSDPIAAVNDDQSGDPAGLEEQLKKLIETTANVHQQIESASRQVSNGESDGFTARLDDSHLPEQDASKSVSAIRERIELLKRLRRRLQSSSDDGADFFSASADAVSDGAMVAKRRHQVGPAMPVIEQNFEHNSQTASLKQAKSRAPQVQATVILPHPVSHLQLGQSLYRTGNYAAALKALQDVDVDTLAESDRTWLELLRALCQRRLGDIDSAEARLREIANVASEDYPIPVARWWLKQTEIIRNTELIFEQTSSELETLIERSKDRDVE